MAKGKRGEGELSKMGMVREALEALGYDAQPDEIDAFIKEKHNREVAKAIISSYKSSIKNSRKPTGAKPGRKPGVAGGGAAGGIQLEDLAAVRGLVSRLGASQVKQLVDVLG